MRIALFIMCFASVAAADPIGDAITTQLDAVLPKELGVSQVFVPKALDGFAPDAIRVEAPLEPRVGRPSVKVIAHHRTYWVPVTLSRLVDVATLVHAVAAGTVLTDDDVEVQHRAFAGIPAPLAQVIGATVIEDLDAGTALGAHDLALQPPMPRGSHVDVEIVRGGLHIKGSGVLELAARTGDIATVRLAFNQTIVRGTMVSTGVVVVGDVQ
ncbi:MAG TPA: flagellar basal body P-ring formation chaperone FlgA [Kofleriaceae bacterium]|jgi:flagella basal body P-ring formation protein FlgA